MLEILSGLLVRELRTLQREVEAYPDEASMWLRADGISNTGGQLAHHITGNLRHYIGTILGRTGYVRDRDAEFSRVDLTRAELLERIADAEREVTRTLADLPRASLEAEYPIAVGGYRIGTAEFLVHLLAHLGYHLGQVDYHRRLLTGSPVTTTAVSTGEIPGARTAGSLRS